MDSDDCPLNDSRESARAEERHRLALYLHDSIGQLLCLAKLQLTRIQDALRQPIDSERHAWLQRTVDALLPELNTAVQAIQAKVFELDLTVLSEVGLTATLAHECAAFIRRTGIPCAGRFEPLDVDAERSALLVLIVREALSNIARHSGATNTEVTLQRAGERGLLTVADNGCGVEPSRIMAVDSVGLRGMQERARALAGEVTVEGRPNRGTRITVAFPLSPRQ